MNAGFETVAATDFRECVSNGRSISVMNSAVSDAFNEGLLPTGWQTADQRPVHLAGWQAKLLQ